MSEIDLEFTSAPVCPHCGHVERDAWEIDFGPGIEGDTETACGSCGEDYCVSRHARIEYSTSKIETKAEAAARRERER